MEKYLIKGPNRLNGEVRISGSKNAALPIITATLLAPGKYELTNVPALKDIRTMCKVLEGLGVITEHKGHKLSLDTSGLNNHTTPYELVKTMRASIYVMGPLLALLGKAEVALPGGCAIGIRPVDIHLKGFEKMGAKIEVKKGFVISKAKNLKGTEIFLEKISVGATANLLMAAVLAAGTTKIFNAAMEPEITDLISFLQKMGAKIKGADTNILVIQGVKKLKPVSYNIIPDRIEAGTFILAALATNGNIVVKNIYNSHLKNLYSVLERMGARIQISGQNSVKVSRSPKMKPLDLSTAPYPGFPTDLQPQLMALLSLVKGKSVLNETIFENRYMHIPELNRMGSDINYDEHLAIIKGVKSLNGAPVMSSDLRAGAALVIAGLAAKGETVVDRIYHIDRGYENLEEKLQGLGAKIKRIR